MAPCRERATVDPQKTCARNLVTDFTAISDISGLRGFTKGPQGTPGEDSSPQKYLDTPDTPGPPHSPRGSERRPGGDVGSPSVCVGQSGLGKGGQEGSVADVLPSSVPGVCRDVPGEGHGEALAPSPALSQQSLKTVGPLEKVSVFT